MWEWSDFTFEEENSRHCQFPILIFSFTEAIFPQVFGTAAGQGILDFGSCAAAAAATATASQQQQQHHAALKVQIHLFIIMQH